MDCLEGMKKIPDNSIDSCVTDPPYGLSKEPDIREVLKKWLNNEPYDHKHAGFMGKTWDSFVPHPDIWREVYRVLKPGAHALVFAGTRTQDLMTISLRLAGFEVRDVIEWLYFSGFPKSLDVGKAFDRRAGAVREVIGKSLSGRRKESTWNPEGKNSGVFRPNNDGYEITAPATDLAKKWDGWGTALKPAHEPIVMVRKPLDGTVADNVEKYGTGAINIDGCRIDYSDEQDRNQNTEGLSRFLSTSGGWKNTSINGVIPSGKSIKGRFPANIVTTEPDAFWSKYCNVTPPELSKKASKRDRNSDWRGEEITFNRNTHPTCKPTDLMAWLVRLATPPGGIVLDPFAGSGSTLVAAKREGFNFIGFELEKEYVEIAEARISGEPEQKALFYLR